LLFLANGERLDSKTASPKCILPLNNSASKASSASPLSLNHFVSFIESASKPGRVKTCFKTNPTITVIGACCSICDSTISALAASRSCP
jgi:hypothetical protein